MQEVLEQCDSGQSGAARGVNLKVVAQVGWAAALLGLSALAESCASRAAASQDMGPRTWADLIRLQQTVVQLCAARYFTALLLSIFSFT